MDGDEEMDEIFEKTVDTEEPQSTQEMELKGLG